ncbi:hypothetical protein SCP_0605230 [Sparassis crispa]|uniref:Uncharacterized protein n=1 Tax=Sparassis crispa TaxID=139825 RepID=A0A401GS39_9APHY|nr:hypothetical protein SCP_0605230 [Sparassis crispa]GBE84544.1 hypothetical protein SCP_0605230 [Sparassis crispa]
MYVVGAGQPLVDLHCTLVPPADAGDNFFLNGPTSVGSSRAEAVPLLRELNDSVSGEATTKDINTPLAIDDGRDWVRNLSLVITHNLPNDTLDTLSRLLWDALTGPQLIAVRSAGFLADFYVRFHEHCVSQPHTDETAPSVRLRDLSLGSCGGRGTHGGALTATDTEKNHFAVFQAQKWKLSEEN